MEAEPVEARARGGRTRTCCCLLLAIAALSAVGLVARGMSGTGIGWHTTVVRDYTIDGMRAPLHPGLSVREDDWLQPGPSATLTPKAEVPFVQPTRFVPWWETTVDGPHLLMLGYMADDADCAAVRFLAVRFVTPGVTQSIPTSDHGLDAAGWLALRPSTGTPPLPRVAVGWSRTSFTIERGRAFDLVMDYELRSTTGAVTSHSFRGACRERVTSATVFGDWYGTP